MCQLEIISSVLKEQREFLPRTRRKRELHASQPRRELRVVEDLVVPMAGKNENFCFLQPGSGAAITTEFLSSYLSFFFVSEKI